MTLTRLPTDASTGELDFQGARRQVRQLAAAIRSDGYRCEWGWAIERNPQDSGYHAHLIQHGDYVPQAHLAQRWGGRIVDVRAIRRPDAATYAVKEATKVAGYLLKSGRENFDGLQEHLRINGGRAAHFSRGFLHGHTSREALQEVAAEMREGRPPQSFHLEPAWAPLGVPPRGTSV